MPHASYHMNINSACYIVQDTPVRIVAVSSLGHKFGGFDIQDLHFRHRSYNGIKAYGQSKLCNILFVRELARRYDSKVQPCTC